MKKKMMIVLDVYELECEIVRRLGFAHHDVDIRQALFYTDYQNDCCKYCSMEHVEDVLDYNRNEKRRSVLEELLKILKEEGIEGDFLVDISW